MKDIDFTCDSCKRSFSLIPFLPSNFHCPFCDSGIINNTAYLRDKIRELESIIKTLEEALKPQD